MQRTAPSAWLRLAAVAPLGLGALLFFAAPLWADQAEEAYQRALSSRENDNPRQAIADLTTAILLAPDRPSYYFRRSEVFFAVGNSEGALDDLNDAIRLQPRWPEAYNNRGSVHWQRREYAEAMKDYDEAIRQNPKFSEAYFNRGNGYSLIRDYQNAFLDFASALRLNPDYAEVYVSRGSLLRSMGEYAAARDDYERAEQIAPNLTPALIGLAWIAAACPDENFRDGREAVDFAKRACNLTDWKEPIGIALLAAAYAEEGRFDDAIAYQKRVLAFRMSDSQRKIDEERLEDYRQGKAFYAPQPKVASVD